MCGWTVSTHNLAQGLDFWFFENFFLFVFCFFMFMGLIDKDLGGVCQKNSMVWGRWDLISSWQGRLLKNPITIFSCHHSHLMTSICAPWGSTISLPFPPISIPYTLYLDITSPLLQNLEKVLDMSNMILTLKPGFGCSNAWFCLSLLLKFQLLVPISFLY